MKSQWECVLQNLGRWQGSFTRLAPSGEAIEDVPSLVTLSGVNNNQSIHFALDRYYPDTDGILQPQSLVFDFSAPGAGAIFFETGAFSEGSAALQMGIAGGAEFAFLHQQRRLRLIQQFDRHGIVSRLTLIREQLVGTQLPAQLSLSLPDLLGEWQGEAIIRYPGSDKIDQVSTTQSTAVNPDQSVVLSQTIGTEITASTFTIETDSDQLRLVNQSDQIMLLPTAAYTKYPIQIKPGEARSLEVGWSIAPNLRQRMIRNYSDRGDWLNVTFITESRVMI
jgi:Domain of unknown function (DUF3598)